MVFDFSKNHLQHLQSVFHKPKGNGNVPRPQTHAGQLPALSVLWDNVDGLGLMHLHTFHDLYLRNCLQQDLTPDNCSVHDASDLLCCNRLF